MSDQEMLRTSLILQNCLVPDAICSNPGIYYRSSEEFQTDCCCVRLKAGQELVSNTYMNMLDVGAWKKYTTVQKIHFLCRIEGKGTIILIHQGQNNRKEIREVRYGYGDRKSPTHPEMTTLQIELPKEIRRGMLYFLVKAETATCLHQAAFFTEDRPDNRVSFSLVICSYRRKGWLEENLKKITMDPALQKLARENGFVVRIVDNAGELADSYGPGIRVYPNENTGGSGGFSRGMEESAKEKDRYGTSHVILMDDDVKLQTESLHRLYALLSYIKPEYRQEPVAGRMFRLDYREMQYTAAEIWNGGDLRHIGFNRDMTQEENLSDMNENEGAEYGGWWFACYPMDFVEKNRPMPFFLHCDDVEYGLRHGGTPIILNGIQVWHETCEYRQSPVVAYYDTRNTLFVNEFLNDIFDYDDVLDKWKQKITEAHLKREWLKEYCLIMALGDWIKGLDWLKAVDSAILHQKLEKARTFRLKNAIAWRYVALRFKRYRRIKEDNRTDGEKN